MDPTVIPAEVALTDDPILRFRHAAYGESHDRRSEER